MILYITLLIHDYSDYYLGLCVIFIGWVGKPPPVKMADRKLGLTGGAERGSHEKFMHQIIKTEIELMGRRIWVEIKETDQDPAFIKQKVEIAFKILLNRENRNENQREENL
jgi:hypothetical protein